MLRKVLLVSSFKSSASIWEIKSINLLRNYVSCTSRYAEKLDENQNQNGSNRQNQQQKQKEDQKDEKTENNKSIPVIRNPFTDSQIKTRESYVTMIELFNERDIRRRNHVEFIYAALKHMADYGVERDLEVYKALINVMPKGKFIPTNLFQSEFMHYPKQQQCIIDLLEQMEDNGVMPDYEMEAMLLNVFGKRGHPLRKYWRMMYWMPKFKNASPWPLPNPVPDDTLEIAKLAVERMCTVDLRSHIQIYETQNVKDALDHTWIVSGMSIEQTQLLQQHKRDKTLFIEGPFLIWIRNRTINYFTLRADPDEEFLKALNQTDDEYDVDDVSQIKVPIFGANAPGRRKQVGKVRSVHQQDDGTIFAICATGTSTKDSLLSWIRLLESNGNPELAKIPILFRFKSALPEKAAQLSAGESNLENTSANDKSNTIRSESSRNSDNKPGIS